MARVTVEDCEEVVSNRFDLVVLAAQRTRQIIAGYPITIDGNDEKKPVIALREIAAKTVSVGSLKESVVSSFRTYVPSDFEEEDLEDLEEDTYNPYVGLEDQAEGVQVVTEPDREDSEDAPGDDLDDGSVSGDSSDGVVIENEEFSEDNG